MKILFYGSKGWIASQIIDYIQHNFEDVNVISSDLHIYPTNINEIEDEIKSINPDRVFCCIGRTAGFDEVQNKFINNIDYLENHLKENMNDNLFAPLILAMICNKLDIHLSYMGTGCIFDENTDEDKYEYTEDNSPDFFGSGYSIVKGYTDQIMKHMKNVLNLRIRMPIIKDYHSKNFITKIFSYKKIRSMSNSMTYLPNMIPIIVDLCLNRESGTYNCVNKGYISHKEIFDIYNKKNERHTYELVDETEFDKLVLSKRSNNILSTKKLEEYVNRRNLTLLDIRECIEDIF